MTHISLFQFSLIGLKNNNNRFGSRGYTGSYKMETTYYAAKAALGQFPTNQPIKSCASVSHRQHFWNILFTSGANFNHRGARGEVLLCSFHKSEAKQSRLIDDQHVPALMRPRCPRPGQVQDMWDFLLPAPLSLILFAFSTAGTAIVDSNYFSTKWYRWKIGVCN